MAGGSTHFRLNGFEWMLKEMELEQASSHVQKLQNLRSPEAFKHFMKSYVDLTKSHGSPFAWDACLYDSQPLIASRSMSSMALSPCSTSCQHSQNAESIIRDVSQ
eukprot:jgi/Tetstr1/435455/TSEL_024361.t1